ncbi:uncharacterized protein LOC124358575 [Homalodisca vitripennis]|uniref:uncharacterized protein LOC124358575 n=1 Tax=Homalodisca vitripennis TaxID=197043 RepID=UPI001EEA10F3|nr:uncharacterized protein LOC124358575 [Homalodisca vitripennis]
MQHTARDAGVCSIAEVRQGRAGRYYSTRCSTQPEMQECAVLQKYGRARRAATIVLDAAHSQRCRSVQYCRSTAGQGGARGGHTTAGGRWDFHLHLLQSAVAAGHR